MFLILILCVILCVFLSVFLVFSGCINDTNTSISTANPANQHNVSEPLLNITPVAAHQNTRVDFTADQLGGCFTEGLSYHSFSDAFITLNGKSVKLDEALQSGDISDADILYFARMDAKNDLCVQITESTHGLTNFSFIYPECKLTIIYDILETPSGIQHLISSMSIHPADAEFAPKYIFYDSEDGSRYDEEFWGINFKTENITSGGLNLRCTQRDGQQIGQLVITHYDLFGENGMIPSINGTENNSVTFENGIITMNGTTELSIDWTVDYGELPSGSYKLNLWVWDQFDAAAVHPLMQDYHDIWCYEIPINIP